MNRDGATSGPVSKEAILNHFGIPEPRRPAGYPPLPATLPGYTPHAAPPAYPPQQADPPYGYPQPPDRAAVLARTDPAFCVRFDMGESGGTAEVWFDEVFDDAGFLVFAYRADIPRSVFVPPAGRPHLPPIEVTLPSGAVYHVRNLTARAINAPFRVGFPYKMCVMLIVPGGEPDPHE